MQLIIALIERFVVAAERIATALEGGAKIGGSSTSSEKQAPEQTEKKETAAQKKKREAEEKAAAEAASKPTFDYNILKASVGKLVSIGPKGIEGIKAVLAHYGAPKADAIPADKWEEANEMVLAKHAELSAPAAESNEEFA